MPIVTEIPERYKNGLSQVNELDETTFEELLSALAVAQPAFNSKAVASHVAKIVNKIAPADIENLVTAILSLYSFRHYYDVSVEELVRNLTQAMETSGDPKLKLNGDQDKFQSRLSRLLNIEALGVPSKALDLLHEYPYTFCHTRILTDIRPIFGPQTDVAPRAALIAHVLRISYHEGRELKEFYVAMDDGDIKSLRDALDRADDKAKSLRSVLERANILLM
jgi:hypothetical protein